MPDLKLIKNPGYAYDLIFLFYYKYNADQLSEILNASESDIEYFGEQIKLFDSFSDDLYIFFRVAKGKCCFFTANYFNCYTSEFPTGYDLAFLQKVLGDHDLFVKNVLKHYFDELGENEVYECLDSEKYLFEVIKKSNYDDKLKARLYEFFIDPESYIRLLQYELMAMDVQLSSYYEKNYSRILDVYNELNADAIRDKLGFLEPEDKKDKINRENLYISFCLLNKGLLYFSYKQTSTLYLIGVDYKSSIERVRKKRFDVVPEQFGAALSDENRVKMLEVILEKGECTCKELEKALGLPASTAYHHASMLEKSGLVSARVFKKSLYYRIERKHFAAFVEYFKRFAESDEKP